MTSALSKTTSTSQGQSQQMISGFPEPVEDRSFNSPVNLGAISADIGKVKQPKQPKGLRVEQDLLAETEALRGKTNLNFNEYVETALLYFNAYLSQHLSAQSNQTDNAA
jgi:hypothetical protein